MEDYETVRVRCLNCSRHEIEVLEIVLRVNSGCSILFVALKDDLASETFVVFCAATYGEGEPPDPAVEFHEWLKEQVENEEEDLLDGVKFAVRDCIHLYSYKCDRRSSLLPSLTGSSRTC